MSKAPKGRRPWSRLSPKERHRLHYRRAKARAKKGVHIDTVLLVKQFRLREGWTQRDLAKRVRVSLRTVKRWESGQFVPTRRAMKWLLKSVSSR